MTRSKKKPGRGFPREDRKRYDELMMDEEKTGEDNDWPEIKAKHRKGSEELPNFWEQSQTMTGHNARKKRTEDTSRAYTSEQKKPTKVGNVLTVSDSKTTKIGTGN